MIQRIQSIWLLLAGVAAAATFKLPFFTGNKVGPDNIKAFYSLTAMNNLIILMLSAVVTALALIAIFLYKQRILQLRLVVAALFISLLDIVLYYLQSQKFVLKEGSFSITAVLSLLIPVFLFLAARGINRDQKLVKSLDRLR